MMMMGSFELYCRLWGSMPWCLMDRPWFRYGVATGHSPFM